MFQSPLVDYVEFPEKGSERKSKREKRSRERKKEGEKWREGPEDRKQKGRCDEDVGTGQIKRALEALERIMDFIL